MDIPEKDPNKSDDESPSKQIPKLPAENTASNMEVVDDMDEVNWELIHLTIHLGEEDTTPTDPGTGQALVSETPPIPRIRELRGETSTSPPVRRRPSRKLDFKPEVATPENIPEKMATEVTTPEKSPEKMATEVTTPEKNSEKMATEVTTPEKNPEKKATEVATPEKKPEKMATEVTTPQNIPGNMSPEVTSDKPCTFGKELYESLPGSSVEALKQRTSPTAPVNPFFLGLGGRSTGQSAQSSNLGLGGRHSGQSAQSSNLGLGGGHSQGQSPSNPNLGLINTAAQGYTMNIMSDAMLESVARAPNVVLQPPETSQTKRALEKSPPESGTSGSPSVSKRHRRVPSTVPEGRPAADVQQRRRLSYGSRGDEPEVRREPRKRSYSSGEENTEIKEKQQKKE